MNPKASFIQYKNKQIYYIDYANIKNELEFLEAIEQTNTFRKQFIVDKPLESQLMLVDLTNSFVIGQVFERLKESGIATKPYLKKQAVVGLTPAKSAMLRIFNLFVQRKMSPFKTVDEAMDWLIED